MAIKEETVEPRQMTPEQIAKVKAKIQEISREAKQQGYTADEIKQAWLDFFDDMARDNRN